MIKSRDGDRNREREMSATFHCWRNVVVFPSSLAHSLTPTDRQRPARKVLLTHSLAQKNDFHRLIESKIRLARMSLLRRWLYTTYINNRFLFERLWLCLQQQSLLLSSWPLLVWIIHTHICTVYISTELLSLHLILLLLLLSTSLS